MSRASVAILTAMLGTSVGVAWPAVGADGPGVAVKAFVHPGILHSRNDLEFIRRKVTAGEEPWKAGWEKLRSARVSSLGWEPKPVARVIRGANNNPNIGSSAMMFDSASAYSHAIQWVVTGKPEHAEKAITILDAWSDTLRAIEGHDRALLAGITAYKFCNAAEIVRHTEAGWPDHKVASFRAIVYPLIKDFKPEANGNWDAAMINSMISIGVFCDDPATFARASDYFLHGEGHGAITHYVFETGQCQESTRDQSHTQLGLGMLAAAAEVAWKQGVDLYGAAGNRLALGFEYTAKYNLGFDVPALGTISPRDRGQFRPIYEKVYQHYAIDQQLAMPFTKQVIDRTRPESWSPDHESWGTLLFHKSPKVDDP